MVLLVVVVEVEAEVEVEVEEMELVIRPPGWLLDPPGDPRRPVCSGSQ